MRLVPVILLTSNVERPPINASVIQECRSVYRTVPGGSSADFAASGYRVKSLMLTISTSPGFRLAGTPQ